MPTKKLQIKFYKEKEEDASISISEAKDLDLMIIPQASMGAKVKQKAVQFHSLIGKEEGQQVYSNFVELAKKFMEEQQKQKFVSGKYGNLQPLEIKSQGPNTFQFEF